MNTQKQAEQKVLGILDDITRQIDSNEMSVKQLEALFCKLFVIYKGI